jgi:hypothetical protein
MASGYTEWYDYEDMVLPNVGRIVTVFILDTRADHYMLHSRFHKMPRGKAQSATHWRGGMADLLNRSKFVEYDKRGHSFMQ